MITGKSRAVDIGIMRRKNSRKPDYEFIPFFKTVTKVIVLHVIEIKIQKNGNWGIDFSGNEPKNSIPGLGFDLNGIGVLDCSGQDSIEKMASFLNTF